MFRDLFYRSGEFGGKLSQRTWKCFQILASKWQSEILHSNRCGEFSLFQIPLSLQRFTILPRGKPSLVKCENARIDNYHAHWISTVVDSDSFAPWRVHKPTQPKNRSALQIVQVIRQRRWQIIAKYILRFWPYQIYKIAVSIRGSKGSGSDYMLLHIWDMMSQNAGRRAWAAHLPYWYRSLS